MQQHIIDTVSTLSSCSQPIQLLYLTVFLHKKIIFPEIISNEDASWPPVIVMFRLVDQMVSRLLDIMADDSDERKVVHLRSVADACYWAVNGAPRPAGLDSYVSMQLCHHL